MKHHWTPGNRTIAILLACAATILLTVTAPSIGLTTDEPAYIAGADSYSRWFWVLLKDPPRAIQPATIESFWTINHEHPPIAKIWSGLVWLATRQVFDDLTANRLGPILLTGFLVAQLYLMIAGTYGKAAGFFAAAGLMSLPRFFFHAHLVALDVPVAVAWFTLSFLFWKTLDRKGWGWGFLWGMAWGLAVATKLNGVFIPIALGVWILVFRRRRETVLRLLLMGVIAVPTFFLVWPWLYDKTWVRVVEYVRFHMEHYGIGQWYFGQFYMPPPWHFALVILWAVVPLTIFALVLMGAASAGNGKHDAGLAWFLILNAFAAIFPFIFGKVLLYDNERLLMPVFPFLAALAGIGFGKLVTGIDKLARHIKRPWLALPAIVCLGIALLTPQSITMAGLYPHLLSYYSENVGGLRGATKLGLETTYWSESFSAALPYINAHATPGDIIWSEDNDILRYYQTIGLLRQDVRFLDLNSYQTGLEPVGADSFENANWYIFLYRQTQFGVNGEDGYLPSKRLEDQIPVYEVSFQGVPLMRLFGPLK